jgi:hypothetical protein
MTALELSATLRQRRNDLRKILGPKYAPASEEHRKILRAVSKAKGKSLAETALEMGRSMDAAGNDPSMLFAAFVDECESGAAE